MKKSLLLLFATVITAASGCAKKQTTIQETITTTTTMQSTTASVVKTVPTSVAGKDVVRTIAANYKGKVVLFDFWATWCGPCRMAMKQIDEIKPEMTKKGCVFVYVTGETSPYNNWESMIKSIDGEHYRLTSKQWDELCKSLNIPGIPAYLLIGKSGKQVYDNLSQGGYPGSDILKNNIEVALTE